MRLRDPLSSRRAAGPALACLALAWVAASSTGCRGEPARELPRGRVTIAGQAVEVEVARTAAARARGLSGRERLAPGTGMLFLHPEPGRHAYWMKGMRFEIDILWLREGRIVDVAHRARRPGAGDEVPVYRPAAEADAVLELPAGYARAHGFDPGQRAVLQLPDDG